MFNYIFLMTKTNYNNRILLFYILPFNISQRIIYVALGIVAFLIAYSAGAAVHMGKQQTDDLKRHFAEQIRGIDQNGIFFNNVRIALGMFVPAAGIGLGVISGFYTGMIFTAIAATSALNNVPPLVILITPFGIMEVFAYGIAISRSGIFIYQIVKKQEKIGKFIHAHVSANMTSTRQPLYPCTILYDTDKQHLCNKQYRHPSYDRHFRFQRLVIRRCGRWDLNPRTPKR